MNTAKRQRLYDYIESYYEEHGFAPTYKEMKAALGYRSSSYLHAMVIRMEADGLLERDKNKRRGVKPRGRSVKSAELLWVINEFVKADGNPAGTIMTIAKQILENA